MAVTGPKLPHERQRCDRSGAAPNQALLTVRGAAVAPHAAVHSVGTDLAAGARAAPIAGIATAIGVMLLAHTPSFHDFMDRQHQFQAQLFDLRLAEGPHGAGFLRWTIEASPGSGGLTSVRYRAGKPQLPRVIFRGFRHALV